MKIKISNGLLIVDILTLILILAIAFIPVSVIRIILGLPFLLFFPGYTLSEAIITRKQRMSGIERAALGFSLSIAVVALIVFGLNYTAWGIKIESVLYSVAAFIILMPIIAIIRRRQSGQTELTKDFRITLPGWESGAFNKTLAVILVVVIVGTIGVLAYTIAVPKVGEKFTEFYILGLKGKAQNYPSEFIMQDLRVTGVKYGESQDIADKAGKVTLGIVNHERQTTSYAVMVRIDGQLANIIHAGKSITRLGPRDIQQGEKWEQEITILPDHVGDNQNVEFLLYKDGIAEPKNSVHFWIDVKAVQ